MNDVSKQDLENFDAAIIVDKAIRGAFLAVSLGVIFLCNYLTPSTPKTSPRPASVLRSLQHR